MKRTIKFCGRDNDGRKHCGYLILGNGETLIFDGTNRFEVDAGSVKQLVGLDCDGREVYEGDLLVLKNGTEYAATFFDNIIKTAKLKEATND